MSEDNLERVVQEILGDVDVWQESVKGPNGPWVWKTLVIQRKENVIHIGDIDGMTVNMIEVHDLPDGKAAAPALKAELYQAHSKVVQEL